MFSRLIALNQKKHMLVGASLIRIAFGFIILYNYAINYFQRHFLWGANGVIGFNATPVEDIPLSAFSLYNFSSSTVYFDVVFHLGIFFAILFFIGYKGRVVSIVNFLFVWSLMIRNNIILDGGDNVSRILLVYLLFVNTTAYFSVDAMRKNKKGLDASQQSSATDFSLRNLLHNLGVLACMAQVCIMYFTSGLHKATGELWQNGTALYYVLQVEEFTHPFFRDLLLSNDLFFVIGTYMAVIAQLAFPFLLFNKFTKYIAMAALISMHLGIAVIMGLISFSFIMIANQLLFLTDKEYAAIAAQLAKARSYVKVKWKRRLVLRGDNI